MEEKREFKGSTSVIAPVCFGIEKQKGDTCVVKADSMPVGCLQHAPRYFQCVADILMPVPQQLMRGVLQNRARCRRPGGEMGARSYSGPPTQMAPSGGITHTVIVLETPGEAEQERRRDM